MNRRELLKIGAVTAAGSLAGLRSAYAAEESGPIKFGYIGPMSGAFAANGKYGAMGTKLIVETAGKVLGRPLQYKVADSQGVPAVGVRLVQDMFQQSNIHLISGASLSSVGLAMGKTVDKLGGVFVTTVGADEVTGTECNRATFRWTVPTYGAVQETIGPLAELLPKAKRWYTITPKYVFGEGLLTATKNLLKEKGLEHVGNSYHSLDEREFSGYLTNAMAAKPDVLVLLNFGSQSSETLRQAVSFGMKSRMTIIVVWASGLEQFQSLGADLCEGVYFGVQYWQTIDSPLNHEFVKLTRDKFNITPNYSLADGYVPIMMMINGIKKAGSPDPAKVIAAMEGAHYEGLTGPEVIRKEDHQVIKDYYLLKAKPKSKMKDKDDYCEILHAGKSFLSPAQAGCKMST